MNILILGGTLYLGRHLTDAALARGHSVTLFNRGRTNADLYPQVEKLVGDRDGDLSALRGRTWDAVIDPSGYIPRIVQRTAEALGDVGHYSFISSISVYSDSAPNSDENAPLNKLPDEPTEDIRQYYGALKAECERVIDRLFPGKGLHVRAGFIVGPYDTNNRFPYWVRRIARGGEVLAPGSPDAPAQVIDARDLAEWTVRMAETGGAGAFNITGKVIRLGDLLDAVRRGIGSDAEWVWVDSEFLAQQQVPPMDGIPYWIPDELKGYAMRSIDRALAAGLTFRPLEDTARDTWAWLKNEPEFTVSKGAIGFESGLPPEREAEILTAWKAQ